MIRKGIVRTSTSPNVFIRVSTCRIPRPLNLTLFESDLMRTEFERLAGRQPMDTLSMKRCAATNPMNKYFKQIPQVRAADAAAGEDD